MPEIVVYLLEGRSLENKRGLVKDVTAAVVKNLEVPIEFCHRVADRNREAGQRQRRRAV